MEKREGGTGGEGEEREEREVIYIYRERERERVCAWSCGREEWKMEEKEAGGGR